MSDIKIARMTVQSKGEMLGKLKGKDARIKDVEIRKPESVPSRFKPVTSWTVSVPGYFEWRK